MGEGRADYRGTERRGTEVFRRERGGEGGRQEKGEVEEEEYRMRCNSSS